MTCNCGREGLPAMFHPESCPDYGGFRPAVFDGWAHSISQEEPCVDRQPHDAHVWQLTQTVSRQCPGIPVSEVESAVE